MKGSFSGGDSVKEPICYCRRRKTRGFSPGLGKSPGGRHGNPFQYFCWRIPWTKGPGGLQSIGSQSQTQLKLLSMHACNYDEECSESLTRINHMSQLQCDHLISLGTM